MDFFSPSHLLPEKHLERLVFVLIFLTVGLGIYLSRSHPLYFGEHWGGDNGWVEWITITGLVFGVLLNIYRANILHPFRSNLFVVCTCLMGMMFFLILGEEISWGQHLFDFEPPDFFIRYNTRGEANFHHLRFEEWEMGRSILERILKPIIAVYCLLLPLLYNRWNRVKRLVDTMALPLPRLYQTLGYIALMFLCEQVSGGMKEDVLEFGSCWILVLMFCRPCNRELFSRVSFER